MLITGFPASLKKKTLALDTKPVLVVCSPYWLYCTKLARTAFRASALGCEPPEEKEERAACGEPPH